MDRMRESMFSILGDLSGSSFLDLFAGSGVVGIEAASRGASPVTLVEKDRRKRPVILKNIAFVESSIELRSMPAERFLSSAGPYSIVYLDPPFAYREKIKLISLVQEHELLEEEGICLIHHPSQEKEWPDTIGELELYDLRSYGGSTLRFFRFGLSHA